MVNLLCRFKNIKKEKRQRVLSLTVGFVFFALLYIITKTFQISICPIKNIFGISCFGCGLTRGFVSILELKFLDALKYNVLSIPLFICILIYAVLCGVDIVFDKNCVKILERYLSRWYMYIVYTVIVIISYIVNSTQILIT